MKQNKPYPLALLLLAVLLLFVISVRIGQVMAEERGEGPFDHSVMVNYSDLEGEKWTLERY